MPAQYVAIKKSSIKKGKSRKGAEAEAAAIYNSKHTGDPVTRTSDKRKKSTTKIRTKGKKGPKSSKKGSKPKHVSGFSQQLNKSMAILNKARNPK